MNGKTYLLELKKFQQSLAQKATLIPSIDQVNAQSALKNELNNIDENSRNLIQSENEVCVRNESCNDDNTEKESANETGIQPLPTTSFNNEMILSKSDTSDGEPSRQKKVIEKKEITQLVTPSATQNNTQHPLAQKIRKKNSENLT